jgi:acyl-CoA synthetase (AMP-forming)/AMP-acid ligase II
VKLLGAEAIPEDVCATWVANGWWDDRLLRDGIEATAARTPDAIAVSDDSSRWTYAELEIGIAHAVGALRAHGVGGESAVLVIAPLTVPAVIAYQAILRSDGVAVMLDRRCGRADVLHAIEAADVTLVVTTPDLAERLDLSGVGVELLTFEEMLAEREPARDWTEPDPRRPIAVVFTSGTTSRPKGVVHSLNTLRSGARNMADVLQLTDRDVAFLSTPLASITGLVQVHLCLDNAAGLLLEDRFDPAASLARLRTEGATVLGGAPVIIEELFKQAQREALTALPLRAISLGGAMIPRPTLELAVDGYGIVPVRIYGSSEVPCSTGTRPEDTGETRISDDGGCANGTEVRTDGEIPGEILVRGPMRMLGYLDEADNEAAFEAGGWYRTGDLGRVESSRLTVTGRLKEIVSRKGLKISLAEIDEVTSRIPGVEEVVAFGVPDAETGERLVLAVRSETPAEVEFDSVIGWLTDAGLAKWKLPEQIVVWDGPFPRTASGKIQRRIVATDSVDRPTQVAPRLR